MPANLAPWRLQFWNGMVVAGLICKALCMASFLAHVSRDWDLSASAMFAKARRVVVVTGASRGLGVGKVGY